MDVEHEGGSTVAAASLSSPSDSKRAAPLLSTRSQSSSRRVSVELSLSHGVSVSELGSPPASPVDAGPSSQASKATRSYDVYIGASGKDPSLIRYAKWMHAELEIDHTLACFTADSTNSDVARTVLHSAVHGVVLITRQSFRNPYTIEELTVLLSRGNLVPVFFDVAPADCLEKQGEGSHDKGLWKAWSDVLESLLAVEVPRRVEAYQQNWRESIRQVAAFVGSNKEVDVVSDAEFPWPRNGLFAGREKELKAMENILFPDTVVGNAASSETVAQTLARGSFDASSSKAETEPESEFGRRSSYDSEIHEEGIRHHEVLEADARGSTSRDSSSSFSGHSNLRDRRAARAARSSYTRELHKRRDSRGESDRTHHAFTPTCVLTGIPGIGKSELAVEFAYRHLQKYRRVLWVGGECRYLRQNYLNLATVLGVDVGMENNNSNNNNSSPGAVVRTFDELEASAVHKVRHGLEKDIPCLVIIDNVDASRDSWDGRELAELLPRAGSAAHVIITTRLPRVMHLDSVEVAFLSSFEALALMRQGKQRSSGVFSVQQIDKFKELETKLGRLTFGLAIVGRLINEFKLKPSELLKKVETVDSPAHTERDAIFGSQPFLVKLLDVCFGLMCRGAAAKSCMAMRMAYVGGWFAPAPCPLSLLAVAAGKFAKELGGLQMQAPAFVTSMLSCWLPNRHNADANASGALLTRLGLARVSPRQDCLYFPDIVQTYCRMRGGVPAARAFVRAMCKSGSVVLHYDHFWAAVDLVCHGFGTVTTAPVTPDFQVPDVLLFTRGLVLPLATRAFNAFSRCTAALEVLRLCYVMLEGVEKSYVADIQADQPLCWRRGKSGPGHQVDEYVWQDLTLLKAVVLEARAKLMLRGGQYDGGEELCRTCISIRTVMLGAQHPDTLAAQQTLSKLSHSKLSHARSR